MINDYKSRIDFRGSDRARHPRLVLIGLVVLALCASALYAALSVTRPATSHLATDQVAPEAASTVATTKNIPLQLPTLERNNPASPQQSPEVAPKREMNDEMESIAENTLLPLQPATGLLTVSDSVDVALLEPSEDTQPSAQPIAADTDTDTDTPEELTVTVDRGHWLEEKVKRGDSLALIFSRLKLSANLLHRIVNSGEEAKNLAKIRPGETIRVRVDQQGEMLELVHQQNKVRSLQILPSESGFTAQILNRNVEKRIANVSGTITNSLYLAAQRAGLSDTLTMELANIFGWDIDFALEIRAGDQFSLIYEEEYLDGKKYRNGAILAAEFVNQGKVFRAIRFEDEEGYASYFSPQGESMRKAFLRAPVDFRRISSRFTKARYHPVLGKKRPHKGVDYAAATGTPIKASGDGRVVFRGNKGGYGRTVMIRHGNQYTTLYAHMSKFRSSIKQGTRVRQGQVIGYVGSSGLATGPHLHYEFRVNGVHRNPLTIKLPAAEPLKKQYRQQFAELSAPLVSQLELISKTMVADAGQ